MATHPGVLIAYDKDHHVIGTLEYLVQYDTDEAQTPLGLVRFDIHEENGGEATDIWSHDGAKGSKVWPEYLGARAHDFRVELEGPAGGKRIAALVHKASGHRRERAAIESAIADRIAKANGGPADIRDLVGGPTNALHLDDKGRTAKRPQRPKLPLTAVRGS